MCIKLSSYWYKIDGISIYASKNKREVAELLSRDGKGYLPMPASVVVRAMTHYDVEDYLATGANRNASEWKNGRIDFQPWPYPSATKFMVNAMKDTDDSIGEIDAMIPRLLKMKKQLLAQKEYIEVAIADSQNTDNQSAKGAIAAAEYNEQPLVVDPRVLLYKHQARLQRLAVGTPPGSTTNGTMGDSINADLTSATAGTGDSDPDVLRAKFSNGRKVPIFKSDQQLTLTKETVAAEKRTGASTGGTAVI